MAAPTRYIVHPDDPNGAGAAAAQAAQIPLVRAAEIVAAAHMANVGTHMPGEGHHALGALEVPILNPRPRDRRPKKYFSAEELHWLILGVERVRP